MEFVTLVDMLANLTFVMLAGVFVAALGLFVFDRSPRHEKSAKLKLVERERRAA